MTHFFRELMCVATPIKPFLTSLSVKVFNSHPRHVTFFYETTPTSEMVWRIILTWFPSTWSWTESIQFISNLTCLSSHPVANCVNTVLGFLPTWSGAKLVGVFLDQAPCGNQSSVSDTIFEYQNSVITFSLKLYMLSLLLLITWKCSNNIPGQLISLEWSSSPRLKK